MIRKASAKRSRDMKESSKFTGGQSSDQTTQLQVKKMLPSKTEGWRVLEYRHHFGPVLCFKWVRGCDICEKERS